MATSVNGAFADFRRHFVDLDPGQVELARTSRDYLQKQIDFLPGKDSTFPYLAGRYVATGSFARKTKIQPLDDIDFLVIMSSGDTNEVWVAGPPGTSRLDLGANTSPLRYLIDANRYINSTKVMNTFKSALGTVANYQKAEIRRDGEAVTFQLASYPWNFDIVPVVEVHNGAGGIGYYLIPNGKGDWMRSDPRKDASATTTANQQHNGLLLPLIRLIKYWNRRPLCPTLPSYYLETICLKTFASQAPLTSLPEGLSTFFQYAPAQIAAPCPDPRGFGPPLDAGWEWQMIKPRIITAMRNAALLARNALLADQHGQVATALNYWHRIFGEGFPAYG